MNEKKVGRAVRRWWWVGGVVLQRCDDSSQCKTQREAATEIRWVEDFIFREDYLVSLSHPRQQIMQHRSEPDSNKEGNIAFTVLIPQ